MRVRFPSPAAPDLEREDITQALQYAAEATNVHHDGDREPA
jgi:hypothetical protein